MKWFLLVCTSSVVWVVMLTMNRDEKLLRIRRENIGFSLWIAVGASGGFFLAFVSFLLYRFTLKRQKLYQGNNGTQRRF